MALLWSEIKLLLRSIVLYLLMAVLLLFYLTQYATEESWESLRPPEPPVQDARGYYGFKKIEDPIQLAGRYKGMMERDLKEGSFQQAKLGFNKRSKLSERDRQALEELIGRLDRLAGSRVPFTAGDVEQVAAELDERLGGNTPYALGAFTPLLPITTAEEAAKHHEEQMALYLAKVDQSQLYPGMARLFADYMGITAGLFPMFIGAFLLPRDRSSRMYELIYSRQIRPWKYVGVKFGAPALLLTAVYGLFAVLAAWQTVSAHHQPGQFLEALPKFLGYTAGWLLPTVWISIAFGMLVSVVFQSGIAAVPLQFLWWMSSLLPLKGSYGLTKLVIRFNTADDYGLYRESVRAIAVNRILYAGLALAMVTAAAVLWERGRSRASGRSGRGMRMRLSGWSRQSGDEGGAAG